MNLLTRSLSVLRTWLNLGDPSDDHLTPSHGWLLPAVEAPRQPRKDGVAAPDPRLP